MDALLVMIFTFKNNKLVSKYSTRFTSVSKDYAGEISKKKIFYNCVLEKAFIESRYINHNTLI